MEGTTVKKIVILGGSYSGLSTAHYLLKHAIPNLPTGEYQVVVVSAASQTSKHSCSIYPPEQTYAIRDTKLTPPPF